MYLDTLEGVSNTLACLAGSKLGMAFTVKGIGRGLSSCSAVGTQTSSLYVSLGTRDEPKKLVRLLFEGQLCAFSTRLETLALHYQWPAEPALGTRPRPRPLVYATGPGTPRPTSPAIDSMLSRTRVSDHSEDHRRLFLYRLVERSLGWRPK